ncbi:sulfotransferase domain-containing protein [Mameliella sediminis]|uniref:sulfotransferase domain-containing protein n=1 Tax=Mameliella sediminis TaxID=2836866 RepID=UPI001C45EE87|nr:sulfotransferase domain-containing protein [Mameliella sediminis]MBY6117296.1 sulfotransferase domain-containing protein [Antarctobacter heliothermus]MBY6147160.1 sulfotransferase domain-containing protein [Mameliella alba]MBV7397357.1 sulfotransferase domain-containing protein [Mameliella sediminis]MBY6172527.1 sulfotransferase domain-containing protein [Mameliella alba]MCA0957203.1 sulfotransferase domain-containing protein [Mameliella alba]
MQKEFKVSDTLSATLEIPEPRQAESVFVVAGHKTGSVLLTKIIADIAAETGLPAVPVEGDVWRQGLSLSDWPAELYAFLEEPGYVFYSFRWLQKLPEVAAFEKARKLFMIRDPRDVAVSYYFSMAKSHGLPKAGKSRESISKLREETSAMDIDSFVQEGKANPILRNIARFANYLDRDDSLFFRYEDVIFDKRNWVAQIARELSVDLSQEICDRIADKHDLRPEKEDPNAHVRSVTPGGYVDKLSPESIAYIHETFPVFFDRFGYR